MFLSCLVLVGMFAFANFSLAENTPPEVTAIRYSKSVINTDASSETIRVFVDVTDDSGVDASSLEIDFFPSSQDVDDIISLDGFTLTSGDATNGTYQADVVFSKGSRKGTWRAIIFVADNEGIPLTFYNMENMYKNRKIINVYEDTAVYRFWSDAFEGHFYTGSYTEASNVIDNDSNWYFEGIAYVALVDDYNGAMPVYRFWSENYKHHFYTISQAERDYVINNDSNWSYEGPVYNAYTAEKTGTTPVYRFWSNEFKGHFYTASQAERDYIINNDSNWSYEGPAFWVLE